jgi:hypothetical protein
MNNEAQLIIYKVDTLEEMKKLKHSPGEMNAKNMQSENLSQGRF